MSKCSRVYVVYTHYPHYREGVFAELERSDRYLYDFFYDPSGIDPSIRSSRLAPRGGEVSNLRVWKFVWQRGVYEIISRGDYDAVIFLGNPYILSTWFAALVAKVRNKRVLYWTHGWIGVDRGLLRWARLKFYGLADALLLYGSRAKAIGLEQGVPENKLFVIGNSLNYPEQKLVMSTLSSSRQCGAGGDGPHTNPYFLLVGRLVEIAAVDVAIEALSLMRCRARLFVVGDGPERVRLSQLAVQKGVDVEFLGPIYDEDRLGQLFYDAVAVVSPGKVGLLALHAMAYGAAVITHGDVDRQMPEYEALIPGVTGDYFSYLDPFDLARVMDKWWKRKWSRSTINKRRAMAVAVIERNYTPVTQRLRLETALDAVLGKNPRNTEAV